MAKPAPWVKSPDKKSVAAVAKPKTRTNQPRSTYLASIPAIKKEIGRVYDKASAGIISKEEAETSLCLLKQALGILTAVA